MRPTRLFASALALAACQREASLAEDAARYSEILAEVGQDPPGALVRCLGLSDEGLRGDCAAVAAVAAARASGDPSWCQRVPEGRWRDECGFQVAEAALSSQGSGRAASLCQQAGAYAADCLVHVWRPELGRLTNGMGPEQLAARYPSAEQLYARTVSQAGASEALESSFWLAFFGTAFRAAGRVEPARCATLPDPGPRRCQDAIALLQTEPLEGLLRRSGQLQAFCAGDPDVSASARLLGVEPSDALGRALRSQQPMICGAGGAALGGALRPSPVSP